MKKCTLLFSLYGFVFFAMDGEKNDLRLLKENGPQPKIMKSIFDCQDYCARRIPLSAMMPKSLMIPDRKGVVMGRKKEVLLFTFLNPKTQLSNVSCRPIITHSEASHCPMIAARKAENNSLIVVSAINCKSREVSRNTSEYIWYSDGFCKVKKLSIPTQAIALDETGKILVVAGDKKIAAIDFAKDKEHQLTFAELKDGEFFVDIAVNLEKEAIPIVAVNNYGEIWSLKLENLNDFFKLSRISSIKTGDAIQKLSYAATESLLYLTRDNEIKSIEAYGLLGEEVEKKHVSSCPKSCDTVIFDRDSTIVYWSCNKINDSSIYEIQVCVQKEGQCQKQFVLEAPVRQEAYTYIKDGKITIGQDYISLIAVHDDLVTALSKYGVFYKWQLNQQNQCVPSDGTDQSKKRSRLTRRRSSSHSEEYSETLQERFKSLEDVIEQAEDVIFRSNSVPNAIRRKKEQSKSLPDSAPKIQRVRSVSTAPAASESPRSLKASDPKSSKTSPLRIEVLKNSASPRPSRENSPKPKSRPSSTSPRSRSNSVVDVKKNEDQVS